MQVVHEWEDDFKWRLIKADTGYLECQMFSETLDRWITQEENHKPYLEWREIGCLAEQLQDVRGAIKEAIKDWDGDTQGMEKYLSRISKAAGISDNGNG